MLMIGYSVAVTDLRLTFKNNSTLSFCLLFLPISSSHFFTIFSTPFSLSLSHILSFSTFSPSPVSYHAFSNCQSSHFFVSLSILPLFFSPLSVSYLQTIRTLLGCWEHWLPAGWKQSSRSWASHLQDLQSTPYHSVSRRNHSFLHNCM